MSERKTTVIMIHETVLGSWLKDLGSAITLLGAISVGVWIGSSALQWVAALAWLVWLFARAATSRTTFRGKPAEAVRWLQETYETDPGAPAGRSER